MPEPKERESGESEVLEFIERRKAYRETLSPYYKAIGLEYDFGIKLKQHEPVPERELARKDRLRVVSTDLPDILRYSSATLAGSAIYMDVRPRGPGKTPAETEAWRVASDNARAAMDEWAHDVDIGYPSARRRFVRMAGAARAGAVRVDVTPGGAYGIDIVPTVVDPRMLAWDSRFLSFTDYGCPELHEDFRVTVEAARENPDWEWDDPGALRPDDGNAVLPKPAGPTSDEDRRGDDDDKLMTLTRIWLKNDPADMEVEIGEPTPLASARWFMACPTCGYSEEDLVDTPGYDGSNLPELQPCVRCGETPEGQPAGMMHRIEVEKQIGRVPQYRDSHRMVIVAPFCPAAGIGRDGPWPKGLTNFPYDMFVPDPFPLEPFGNSDTFRNQDLASMKNASLASGFEQMERNRDLLVAVEDALWDAQHEPYQFDGSGDFVAYTDRDGLNAMKHFQGSGLNVAYTSWMSLLNSELSSRRGIGQVNASAQEMKNTPVGTVARIQETGDVPLDEQQRILREMEERLFNRVLELMCAYWDEDRWVEKVGEDGRRTFALFSARNAPSMRLRVKASPSINAVDVEKWSKLKELNGAPPSVIKFMLRDSNMPEDVIADLIGGSGQPPVGGDPASISPQGHPLLAGAAQQ